MNQIWHKVLTSEILTGVLAFGSAFFPIVSLGIIGTLAYGYMGAKRVDDIKQDIFQSSIKADLLKAQKS